MERVINYSREKLRERLREKELSIKGKNRQIRNRNTLKQRELSGCGRVRW
jgi:hypothetical protein